MKTVFLTLSLIFSFTFLITSVYSQDYPDYSVEALDKTFNYRLNHIEKNGADTSAHFVFDYSVINLANQGVYIPTSLNIFFENIDSLLAATRVLLTKEQNDFISYLQEKGIANITKGDFKKSAESFSSLTKNKSLRLCFYAVYDIEMAKSKKEIIIIDWDKDGRKYYTLEKAKDMFTQIKTKSTQEITGNCTFGVGEYSFFLIGRNGEVYPKIRTNEKYLNFYFNDAFMWDVIDQTIIYFSENYTQEFNIVFISLNINCTTTVKCPEQENPFGNGSGGFGKDSGSGFGSEK
jgi:hypothetical protein